MFGIFRTNNSFAFQIFIHMDKIEKTRCELVEKLGIHMEKKEQLAPVAARIFSYIVLNGKQGVTFDELVTNLCASKSTISTHLNHLQDLKKIEYFTKSGDRKKYFIANRHTILQGISEMVAQWEYEKELHIDIMEYKKNVNKTRKLENMFDLSFHESFIEFLDGAISSINKLKLLIINNQQ